MQVPDAVREMSVNTNKIGDSDVSQRQSRAGYGRGPGKGQAITIRPASEGAIVMATDINGSWSNRPASSSGNSAMKPSQSRLT